MSHSASEKFLDFYELMQISPNAEPETVQRVYRMLAARYHPDNTQTGDPELFVRVSCARPMTCSTRSVTFSHLRFSN
jgi:curved DNA-binding protein CbpA